MTRCRNATDEHYATYGAKGIKVCEHLDKSPEALIALIGERPSTSLSIDRFPNPRGNYSCGTCEECLKNGWIFNIRWATDKEQARNQITNRMITLRGETRCMSEWAELLGKNYGIVRAKIRRGWTPERAFA